ncbi:MAG: hypothetical protein K0U64_08270 [Actinomycetia bacterium]|nr:hypothetical protein [Actinomycetes bacterium]
MPRILAGCRSVVTGALVGATAAILVVPQQAAVAADPVSDQPVAAADHPTPDDGRARLKVTVTGKRLDQPARIKVRGVSGPALGYRRTLRVRDSKVLRRAPLGGYRLKAKVIKVDGDPKADPAFRDDTRTAAAQEPVQRIRLTSARAVRFHYPAPPKFPRNFRGKGRYIVRDLGFNVPFTWNAKGGEIQMIAGGKNHPIHFTNVIQDHVLYTKTYKWPGVEKGSCLAAAPWDRGFFNDWFATARYVGPVTLEGKRPQRVNHFRTSAVIQTGIPLEGQREEDPPYPGNFIRVAIASADFFVDQSDSRVFRNVQHFGYQNLLDPVLDEWIQMKTFSLKPGKVKAPSDC